ncbi:hypothetical protein KIW84_021985 [Lathyrus oleraceus]|uniref:F-box domain-containing protein n=1 Tax=Pisum sativum TaxID=3888 RepID=A0A9D5BA56_PEA|nr:hypothetical protein KIW84_021985 [Pisum sativum]
MKLTIHQNHVFIVNSKYFNFSTNKTLSFCFTFSIMSSSCLSLVMEIDNLEITADPNWLELPRDITMNILQRLDTVALVTSASVVCPLWWNICKDPHMWTTIDMMNNLSLTHSELAYSSRLEKICRYAVDRSCGHLKDIYIKSFGTDGVLLHIANR